MYNLQLLCRRCNRRKSNTFDENETQKAVNLVRTKYKYCENAENSLVRDAWKIEHQSFTTWLYKNGINSPFVAGDLLKMYIQHMQESGFDVVPYLTYMTAHNTCVCSEVKEIA